MVQASEPAVYKQLQDNVDSKLQQSQGAIAEFISDAMRILVKSNIRVEDVEGRPKSLRSIQNKLQPTESTAGTRVRTRPACVHAASGADWLRQPLSRDSGVKECAVQSLDNVHDVLAVRIIVGSKNECYSTMRELSNRWPQIPGREKNYIKNPKPNGYQSMHNVFVTDCGLPIEVQLRTPQMHWNAEFGVASHWRYKERESTRPELTEEALTATHDHLVAWTRMVLTYGHGVRDYRKSCGGTSYMRANSTLSEVTQAIMAAGPAAVDNGDLPAPSTSGTTSEPLRRRRCSLPGGPAGAPRRTFADFVASTMAQPACLQSVLVALSHAGRAEIRALDAAIGASSVGQLLCSGNGDLAGVHPARVLVNGVPALGATHPLKMGDCVRVLPPGCPASLTAAAQSYFEGLPAPLMMLRQHLTRAVRTGAADGNAVDIAERVDTLRDGISSAVARNMGHVKA